MGLLYTAHLVGSCFQGLKYRIPCWWHGPSISAFVGEFVVSSDSFLYRVSALYLWHLDCDALWRGSPLVSLSLCVWRSISFSIFGEFKAIDFFDYLCFGGSSQLLLSCGFSGVASWSWILLSCLGCSLVFIVKLKKKSSLLGSLDLKLVCGMLGWLCKLKSEKLPTVGSAIPWLGPTHCINRGDNWVEAGNWEVGRQLFLRFLTVSEMWPADSNCSCGFPTCLS